MKFTITIPYIPTNQNDIYKIKLGHPSNPILYVSIQYSSETSPLCLPVPVNISRFPYSKFRCVFGPKQPKTKSSFLFVVGAVDLLRFCLSDCLIAPLLTISSFAVGSVALSTNLLRTVYQKTHKFILAYSTSKKLQRGGFNAVSIGKSINA